MPFPLSLDDISFFLLGMTLILFITSELVLPYYGKNALLIEKELLRKAAFLLLISFMCCAAVIVYGRIIAFT